MRFSGFWKIDINYNFGKYRNVGQKTQILLKKTPKFWSKMNVFFAKKRNFVQNGSFGQKIEILVQKPEILLKM